MGVKRYAGTKGKCDIVFSKIVRSIGHCEHCGIEGNPGKAPGSWVGPNALQCAHIRSRRYSSTRCETINAVCLCDSCHRDFTANPHKFIRWVDETYGEDRINQVNELSNVTRVWRERDWEELHVKLKNEWDAIRGNG